MNFIIALYLIIISTLSVVIQQIQLYSLAKSSSGEFDNALVIKSSKSLRIQSEAKNITLMNVPDVYQATDYTCGPSSLTAVLSYYGKLDFREMHLAELAKTDSQIGTMPQKLYRAILQLGFQAQIRQNMSIYTLQEYLAANRPVIVLIQAWKDDEDTKPYPTDFEDGHYVVAIGYDNQNIYFQDPWIHGSLTYMRKDDLFDRWHGNTDQPKDRRIYGSGIIVLEPIKQSSTVIYLE